MVSENEKRKKEQFREPSPDLTLAEAKRNFQLACAAYEPLEAVKRHPFIAPAFAMLAGYIFVKLIKPVSGIAILPFALQTAQLGLKFLQNYHKK